MKLNYEQQRARPEWGVVRKEVYKRADYRCQLCGKKEKLHAHHSYYSPGKMAWEYPICSLIALCAPCHAKAAHGNPDEAIAAAVAETKAELGDFHESELASHDAQEFFAKQILAYVIDQKCNGELIIPLAKFSPLAADYTLEQSYDDASYSLKFTAKLVFDGNSAFGILIKSRSSDKNILSQMVEFAKLLHSENLHHYVKEIFHDSKFNICNIHLDRFLEEETTTSNRIFTLAYRTINVFDWFGSIQGKGYPDPSEAGDE